MSRRVIMTAVLGTAIAATRVAPVCGDHVGVLVEAESFADKGGWVVDQQFMDVMGSPYLLAHGLGRPVTNATTTVAIPRGGSYRVWVRTRNWVPGDWEAPGRFRLHVNGRALATEFGTETGWGWQVGGSVKLAAGATPLALEDLTGFDGRCDAIFLTTDTRFMPPNAGDAMRTWRNAMHNRPATPPAGGDYDVVIVGGGISGCGAALAAAEQGLHVALIHDRPVLGGNASSEVRVHTIGIVGKAGRILNKVNTRHWPNGSPEAVPDTRKRHRNMEGVDGLDLFLKWRAYDAVTQGKRIRAVYAQHTETGESRFFRAPVFIDCTGDGWIGYWAGAEFRYGREARDEFEESWEKHGNLWSPETPDNRIMGSSLLWYALPKANPASLPRLPWAEAVARSHVAVKGEWYWEYSNNELHAIRDAEAIRDHLLRAIYGTFANTQRQAKYAGYELAFVGYVSGKRESRRLMGDYVYTMKDATEGRDFPDAVVEETRDIDLHYQRHEKSPGFKQDFLSTALFMKVPRYRLPFRTLYSRNIDNLMMAGRCFSCSHVGLGGPRVMNTCGQMGVAVGYAAYLCKQHDATPRGVYQKHLTELLELVNAGAADIVPATPGLVRVDAPTADALRTADRYPIVSLPGSLRACSRVVTTRGSHNQASAAFKVTVTAPVQAYLAVHQRGEYAPPAPWKRTALEVEWSLGRDTVYEARFPAGVIEVPSHTGKVNESTWGLPHLLLLAPAPGTDPAALQITPVKEH